MTDSNINERAGRRIKRISAVVLIAGLMIAGILKSAGAYIPPAPFIVEMMIEHLNMPSKMAVHQQLVIPTASEETARSFDQQIRYRLPESFRSDIHSAQFTRIHVANAESSITVVDGTILSQDQNWDDHFKDLFWYRSRKKLVAHLDGLGIDTKTASIGRLDKMPVFVVGAVYPDETLPQVWIEKDFFRPVRWIISPAPQPGEPARQEIRYADWRLVNKTWYPGRIEFFQEGQKTHEMITGSIDMLPVFSPDLFNTAAVRARYEFQDTQKGDDGSSDSEIRRQIEEFKQIYE